MSISKISVRNPGKSDDAILIVVDGKTVKLSQAAVLGKTAAQLETAMGAAALLSNVQLPTMFFHVNRDASLVVATGKAPNLWPEDEIDG